MIPLPTVTRLAGLLLAALIAAGCGAPAAPPPSPAPELGQPTPAGQPGAYPPPDGQPVPAGQPTAYPAPAAPPTPDPNPGPYPAPTQSGAAPLVPTSAASPTPEPNPSPSAAPTQSAAAPPNAGFALDVIAGAIQPQPAAGAAPILRPRVVATYPHDPGAYTQGLVYIGNDTFYEGTGWYAASSLREVALATGEVRRIRMLSEVMPPSTPERIPFGEGIAVVGDRIFQLTWQEGRGVIYDHNFQPITQFTYPPPGQALPVEGWGLTYDPAAGRLIMSDGTANLYFVDPVATERTGVLAITGQVEVRDAGIPVFRLNELELINGEVFANLWTTELIARIDPASGQVNSYLDLSELRTRIPSEGPQVLNGIAYDAAGDRLFVTGKNWPQLFEIDLPVAQLYLPLAAIVSPALPRLWS